MNERKKVYLTISNYLFMEFVIGCRIQCLYNLPLMGATTLFTFEAYIKGKQRYKAPEMSS